ncbi:MAG: ferric reductase-like transmembrane domain-containing protein, partial [Candidatus Veblenbacteria bacterium]|nr:ferric reductase-like transmembrane domain-containing protein [Candidatus Veblenbacteria bacterium]
RLVVVSVGSAVLWLAEFWYQYNVYEPGNFIGAWVRSNSLTGATLISLALLLSGLFKWVPRWARHYRWRRNIGVAGFVFITLHVAGVLHYVFHWRVLEILYSWQPFENPLIFGLLGYTIILAMALTSSEWTVRKLRKWWKFIHRFIYLAEVGIIFHILLLGDDILESPPGYLLYGVGGAAVLGQVYWWMRVSAQRKFRNAGFWVGLGTILLALFLWLLAARLNALSG